jgi:glycosyltransferase involved in cell wall biosynthesis
MFGKLDIIICTHNPRLPILRAVLSAVSAQPGLPEAARLVLVDSHSTPPLEEEAIRQMGWRGPLQIIRTSRPGHAEARVAAWAAIEADWLWLVDDDAQPDPHFLAHASQVIGEVPDLGCLGGPLRLPAELLPPQWVVPFLPFLAVFDRGPHRRVGREYHWGPWVPAGSLAVIRREVYGPFAARHTQGELAGLGRRGETGLGSCDDACLFLGASALGLSCAYDPGLSGIHHLRPGRFVFSYLVRLLYGYGQSQVLLENLLEGRVAFLPRRASGGEDPDKTAGGLMRSWQGVALLVAYTAGRAAGCLLARFRLPKGSRV